MRFIFNIYLRLIDGPKKGTLTVHFEKIFNNFSLKVLKYVDSFFGWCKCFRKYFQI